MKSNNSDNGHEGMLHPFSDGTTDTHLPADHVHSTGALKKLGIEPDQPPNKLLFVFLFLLTLVMIATFFGIIYLLKISTQAEVQKKVLSLDNPALNEIRARDTSILSTYDVIDSQKGIYQIPIDVAMKHLINNSEYIQPMQTSPLRPRK